MARTVVVGDVHGCHDELVELLDKVGFGAGDRLVFVGDVIARGPASAAVVALARRLRATLVRGNHEEKLLRWYRSYQAGLVGFESLSEIHQHVAKELCQEDWRYFAASPVWAEFSEHKLRVVHAGVLPGVPIERQARSTLLTIRSVSDTGEPQERPGPIGWAAQYQGPEHVVFGHHAQYSPQLHPYATGIDTACVYGGALTALVLRRGETVVPVEERHHMLVSVPARRRWFAGRRGSK